MAEAADAMMDAAKGDTEEGKAMAGSAKGDSVDNRIARKFLTIKEKDGEALGGCLM